jgi:hypothetical protein
MARLKFNDEELVRRLVERCNDAGWTTSTNTLIGWRRSDVIAVAPSGRTYILELRLNNKHEHVASLAHVSALRRALTELGWPGGGGLPVAPGVATVAAGAGASTLKLFPPVGILVSAGSVVSLAEIARQLDLQMISIDRKDPVTSANRVFEVMKELERLSNDESESDGNPAEGKDLENE